MESDRSFVVTKEERGGAMIQVYKHNNGHLDDDISLASAEKDHGSTSSILAQKTYSSFRWSQKFLQMY